jgi:hypothetical protein
LLKRNVLTKLSIEEATLRDEIEGVRRSIDAARRIDPKAGATSIEVAGGLVAFAGADSPFSQASGVGTRGPVRAADVAKITEFYESRGAIPMVFVAPAAHPSLASELAAAGYAPGDREQTLVASGDLMDRARRHDRIGVANDIAAWAKASAAGFLERDELEPGDDVIALILATAEGTIALEARDGVRIIATGAMSVIGGNAALFAGSTLTAFRRQGWHTALICDRVARALQAGATLVRTTASLGSVSEQNFVRCGFVSLYTKVLWLRSLPASSRSRETSAAAAGSGAIQG